MNISLFIDVSTFSAIFYYISCMVESSWVMYRYTWVPGMRRLGMKIIKMCYSYMLRKRTFLYVGIFLSYMQSYFIFFIILKLPQEHVFSQSIKCLLLISGTHTCITWSGIPICTYIFPPNPQNDAFCYWQSNLLVLVIIAPSQHGRFDSFQQCCNDRMYANKYLI